MSAAAPLPISVDEARRLFAYDEHTGQVTRRVTRGGVLAGSVVGTLRADGYLEAKVNGRMVLLHRLAWLLHYGEQPPVEVDHEDGNRANTRILNLRRSARGHNNQNRRKAHKNNRLGILGVHELAPGKFLARIRVNKQLVRLGIHPTAEAASQAYVAAKRQFHEGNTL